MTKTIVYIDGFNLFYGLLQHKPNRWLDLVKFAEAIVGPHYDILTVKYFTSKTKSYPENPQSLLNQHYYWLALSTLPKIKLIEGFYQKSKRLMPFYREPCKSCSLVPNHLAPVVKLEEKRSDVNIATEMLMDAISETTEAFTLITGDSDLAAPVQAIRYRLEKPIAVFNPHKATCLELKRSASFYKNIPEDLPTQCQLPYNITLPDGTTIHVPTEWTTAP